MNDTFEAVLAGEIPALEQEIAASPMRREAIKKAGIFQQFRREEQEKNYLESLGFCLEYCGDQLYVPSTFMDLHSDIKDQLIVEVNLCLRMKRENSHLEGMRGLTHGRGGTTVDLGREITKEMEGLIHESVRQQFEAVRNIIFYRRTIVLQRYVEQLERVVPSIEPSRVNASLCGKIITGCLEGRHKRPLSLLTAKELRIEGDPYKDLIRLLRPICQAYGSSSLKTPTAAQNTDPSVDQAFKRILETLSSQAQANKKAEELAAKCQMLKIIFPDAQGQIDKLFRQEIDGLKQ